MWKLKREYSPQKFTFRAFKVIIVFTTDGDFYAAWDWKLEELKEKLRRRILKAFVRWEKLSPEGSWFIP